MDWGNSPFNSKGPDLKLVDISNISSNPVFIEGYPEYIEESAVGNILYTAILFL